MFLLQETKLICKKYEIKPNRSKGQNFLITEDVYNRIINCANLSKNDIILEVGPGLGVLTRLLCKKAKKVIAIELDKKIFNYLQIVKKIEDLDNLELLNKNILDLEVAEFPLAKFKVVANLPYNITSVFLRKFSPFVARKKVEEMILTLQKEVAERIIANPGQMSLLSLSVQFYGEPQIIDYINKRNFWPQPKVDSAIIKIKPISDILEKEFRLKIKEKNFFQIAKIGFSAKRKKLVNNLANGLHKKPFEILPFLQKAGLNPNTRAQELGVKKWIKLARIINDSSF